MSHKPSLLRSRDSHARVTFVELFFDLVFVFAVTQLSHSLLEHLSFTGALQTLFLLLAVWWVWMYTCWFTNWIDPDKPVVRVLLFTLMLGGLLMSAAIPNAFGHEASVVRQRLRVHPGRAHGFHGAGGARARSASTISISSASWLARGRRAVLWIGGGFAAGIERVALWTSRWHRDAWADRGVLLRAGPGSIEHGGLENRRRAHGRALRVVRDHRAGGIDPRDRCDRGVAARDGREHLRVRRGIPRQRRHVVDLFQHRRRTRQPAIAHPRIPAESARAVYTYFHIPIVAGIVVCAVADEITITHPTGHLSIADALVLLGGPALYLGGNVFFKRASAKYYPLSHLVGLGLLVLLVPVAMLMTPLMLGIATTIVLIIVAVWETRSFASSPSK